MPTYRLIIDRSILLLLSASKCCLGSGDASQEPNTSLSTTAPTKRNSSALEARKLIGVQIRVSIGIIMALVKCSVFGSASCSSSQTQNRLSLTSGVGGVIPSPVALQTAAADYGGDIDDEHDDERGGFSTHSMAKCACRSSASGASAECCNQSAPPLATTIEPLMSCCNSTTATNLNNNSGSNSSGSNNNNGDVWPPRDDCKELNSRRSLVAAGCRGGEATTWPTGHLARGTPRQWPMNETINDQRWRFEGEQAGGSPSRAQQGDRHSLDIMGRFLLTLSGTFNAHDAIRAFQVSFYSALFSFLLASLDHSGAARNLNADWSECAKFIRQPQGVHLALVEPEVLAAELSREPLLVCAS